MNVPSGKKEDPPNQGATAFKFGCGEANELLLSSLWPGATVEEWKDWKWQSAHTLRTVESLAVMLNLKPHQVARYKRLIDIYHYAITPYYFSLIDWTDPEDPVRKQAVPNLKELEFQIVGNNDPLDEEKDMPVPGLVHRYPDRVLTVITNMCSMYCRHCTRKRIWGVGEEGPVVPNDLAAMVHYIKKSPEIREVVVSGGDPLTMNMDLLDWFLGELRLISHVEVIRIGTRVPVVLPMKVTDDLVRMLASHRPLWINTQFNHPREITPQAQEACDRILRAGIPVSNQSVLLRGINDSPDVMKRLCHGLQRIMVRPYYLFQCDPVRGVEHFRTSVWKGIEIIENMRGHTGGLCIPSFVVDAPGGGGKVPLQPFYLLSASDREVHLRNYEGMIIKYFNPPETDIPAIRKPIGSGRDEADLRVLNQQAIPSVPKESSRYRRRMKKNLVPLYKGDV